VTDSKASAERFEKPLVMNEVRTLLLIDNDPAHAEVFQEALRKAPNGPFRGEWVRSLGEGLERLKRTIVWAVVLNSRLSGSERVTAFERLSQAAPRIPTLVLAGADDEAIALEALRRGAKDYLLEGHIDSYSFIHAIRHMTERESAEEILFMEKQRAQVTLDSIGDGVLCTDIEGNVTYLNAVAELMTGWSREKALGKRFAEVFEIIDGQTREPAQNPMDSVIKKNRTVGLAANCILIRRDGYESAIEDSAAPIHDRFGEVIGAVIVFHDMGISRVNAGEMKHLAEHDILTDLPNRLLLKDRLTQAIAGAQRNTTELAVLFLDLDHFKRINDSLSHAVADKLLQSVAARLVNCVRGSDTVSRQGGDEFVVLLSEITHAADARITARKLLNALAAPPHAIDQHNLYITASIGISTYPQDGRDADALIGNADAAMYRAKGRGGNNCQCFNKNEMSPTDQVSIPQHFLPGVAL
jgi:diguanylate cyclase (GGDEF)-like protein/PAS domain S-box-containing protein